jgi:hypothetical protein
LGINITKLFFNSLLIIKYEKSDMAITTEAYEVNEATVAITKAHTILLLYAK